MARKPEIYVSIDIEADGPCPGVNSMLSLGAAAFTLIDGPTPVATYEVNLETLPGAVGDPATMKWWLEKNKAAWDYVTANPVDPEQGIREFVAWVKALPGNPVMVVYPTWDFMWVHWYIQRFYGKSPFGIGALDMKSLGFGHPDLLKAKAHGRFKEVSKRNMPGSWFKNAPRHDHTALTDAIGQGVMFINMMRDIMLAQGRLRG